MTNAFSRKLAHPIMNWFKLISFWRAEGLVGSGKPRFGVRSWKLRTKK